MGFRRSGAVHMDRLGCYALAVVVTFGIAFLLWTLVHLIREERPANVDVTPPHEERRRL